MKIMSLVGCVFLTYSIWSCDICGGVSGNAYIGLLASTQFHMIGMKSNFNSYRSYLEGIVHSRERLFQQELTGRWQLAPRIQLIGSIPYQIGMQKRDLGTDIISGLGDPRLVVNYILLHQKDDDMSTRNFLSLGGGIKSPLGKKAPETSMIRNLYPGTGAWNISGLLVFTKRITHSISLQQEGICTFKTSDKSGFRYGNTYSYSATLVWNKKVGIGRIICGPGLMLEYFDASTNHGLPLEGYNNQGYLGEGQLNIHYLSYRWLWGMNVKQPIIQNFNEGSMKQGPFVSISLSYLITKTNKNELKN